MLRDEKLYRCIDCNCIFYFTDYDSSPIYIPNGNNNDFIAIYQNERTSLINTHIEHKVIELEVDRDSIVSEGFFENPLSAVYIQAKDSVNFYVVKKWKDNFDESLKCEVVGEFLSQKVISILPQKDCLKKDLIEELKFMSDDDAENIVTSFGNACKKIRYSDFTQIYPDEECHLTEYAVPNKKITGKFIRCATEATGEDRREEFIKFILKHTEPYDSLNFIIKKTIKITKRRSGNRLLKFPSKDELVNLNNVS